MEIFIRYYF